MSKDRLSWQKPANEATAATQSHATQPNRAHVGTNGTTKLQMAVTGVPDDESMPLTQPTSMQQFFVRAQSLSGMDAMLAVAASDPAVWREMTDPDSVWFEFRDRLTELTDLSIQHSLGRATHE